MLRGLRSSVLQPRLVRSFSRHGNDLIGTKTPLVSIPIVGRPNVGKSSLFNRLCASGPKHHRRSAAIVSPFAGTTRDRREAPARISGASFIAIDTGGLESESINNAVNGRLNKTITSQVAQAVIQSKVAIFMIDAREGVTPIDEHFALWARKQQGGKDRKWIILLNKAEAIMSRNDDGDDILMHELLNQVRALGLGDHMMFISAQSGDGFGSLASSLLPYIEGNNHVENDDIQDKEEVIDVMNDDLFYTEEGVEHFEVSREEKDEVERIAKELEEDDEDDNSDEEEGYTINGEEDEGEGVKTKWDKNKSKNEIIELAIVGRPNVGKSSLVNAILQQDRVCVGPMPGVTRDSIPVDWQYHGRQLRLVDTAGIRKFHVDKSLDPKTSPWSRSSGVEQEVESLNQEAVLKLEQQSIAASLKSLGLASVVVMVLDGSVGEIRRIELSLASKIMDEGRALVIAANKGDLILNTTLSKYRAGVVEQAKLLLPQHGDVPVVAMSALTGDGVKRLLPAVVDAHDRWSHRITTGVLNKWLIHVQKHHKPKMRTNPSGTRSATKLKFITQLKGRPPTFVIFVNNASGIRGDFISYLKNNLRDEFNFHGIPMRIIFRSTSKKLKVRLSEQGYASSLDPSSSPTPPPSSSSFATTLNNGNNVSKVSIKVSSTKKSNKTLKIKETTDKKPISSKKFVSKKKRISLLRKSLRD